jgi:hypothetical protein
MLLEEGSGRNLVLASFITSRLASTIRRIGTRNILTTNLVSIYSSFDYIAYIESIKINSGVIKTREGKEETVGLFTAEADSTNISFIRFKVTSDVVAGIVLLADEIILLCELYGQLAISREVYTNFTLGIVGRYTDGITEYICQKQAISIRVLTHIS